MKKQIREVLSKYRGNQGYTIEHAESELLNLYAVSRRSELLSAFSWVSLIGEQFFDSSKTVDDMVDAYQKSR